MYFVGFKSKVGSLHGLPAVLPSKHPPAEPGRSLIGLAFQRVRSKELYCLPVRGDELALMRRRSKLAIHVMGTWFGNQPRQTSKEDVFCWLSWFIGPVGSEFCTFPRPTTGCYRYRKRLASGFGIEGKELTVCKGYRCTVRPVPMHRQLGTDAPYLGVQMHRE